MNAQTQPHPYCTKKSFDRIGAIEAMYSARYSKKNKRRECRYYWCSDCRAYHLTSMPLAICGGREVRSAAAG